MTRQTLIAAAVLLAATQAQAYTASLSAGPSTSVLGASVETFESYVLGALNGGTVYGWNSPGASLTGDNIYLVSGVSAQPKHGAAAVKDQWFSINNGQTATFTFAGAQTYVGFLWGSVDTYNTVSFYNGASLLASFTGGSGGFPTQVPAGNGNQASAQYLNFSDASITSVTFASSGTAFEIDNLATIAAVPEPETYALLMAGLGAVGFMARRRAAKR